MKIISLMFFLIVNINTFASESYKLKHAQIKVDVPSGWQEAEKLFGVQLMFLGPMKGERRPVITVDSTPFDLKFDAEALKMEEGSYRKGRLEWLSKYSGNIIKFYPYKKTIPDKKTEIHSLGYSYELGEFQFVEHTHYITCGRSLVHVKTLVLVSEETLYKKDFDKFLSNIRCEWRLSP